LRKLGEALGVRLFEVQGKRLVPTDAAYALLPTAREVFASFERCEQALAGLRVARGTHGLVSESSRANEAPLVFTLDDVGWPPLLAAALAVLAGAFLWARRP
jgi:DNA-binding transcriptional LysR family regulator